MPDLRIGTFIGLTRCNLGDILIVLHQYAYHGQGKTIHSSPQLEAFGNQVDDKAIKAGGTQTITTHKGVVLPLDIRDGLPYLTMRKPSLNERKTLPFIILTADVDWDPSILDLNISNSEEWTQSFGKPTPGLESSPLTFLGLQECYSC